jgi:pre-mRNA-splicing factor ATP-dependent RNA helicase DHX38/PRP16
MDFDDDTGKRQHILVHDLKPPFLDGRVVFTTQQEMVSVTTVSQQWNNIVTTL